MTADSWNPGQWADVISQGTQSGSGTAVIGSTSGSSALGFLLYEDGHFALLENGNKIRLE